jgi:hypothetical protein
MARPPLQDARSEEACETGGRKLPVFAFNINEKRPENAGR